MRSDHKLSYSIKAPVPSSSTLTPASDKTDKNHNLKQDKKRKLASQEAAPVKAKKSKRESKTTVVGLFAKFDH